MKKILIAGCMFMFAFMISAQNRGGAPGGDMTKRYEEMKKELSLNDQQVDSLKVIDQEFFTTMREQREKNGNDREKGREIMQKMNEQRNERVKAILSEEQFTKYQEMENQRRQRSPGGPGGKR